MKCQLLKLFLLLALLLLPLHVFHAAESKGEAADSKNEANAAVMKAYQQYMDSYRAYDRDLKRHQAITYGLAATIFCIGAVAMRFIFRKQKQLAEQTLLVHVTNQKVLEEIRDILKQGRG